MSICCYKKLLYDIYAFIGRIRTGTDGEMKNEIRYWKFENRGSRAPADGWWLKSENGYWKFRADDWLQKN